MKQLLTRVPAAACVLALAACQDSSSPGSTSSTVDVATAFSSLPVGFSNVQSTFDDSTETDWTPGRNGSGPHHNGGPEERSGNGMMCGGLGGFLDIGLGFRGRGVNGGDSVTDCAFEAATGRVACPPQTRDGLTISRSAAYTDASGTAQERFDSVTTNTVNVQVQVSDTRERRNGNSTTVEHASDRTISGLGQGSDRRTIDGTSAGKETTTGSDSTGSFNAVRIIGDTIQGVVVPTRSEGVSYPTAGTIVRSMYVTATYEGQTPTTASRREVVTFDGSNTASVVITEDGKTQSCTLTLPGHQLSCS